MAFNEQVGQDGAWRQEFSGRLKLLARWLAKQGLCSAAVQERLQQLGAQARPDKVMLAFVAHCPRSKAELINAIFFAGPVRSMLPAGAGRATLCTTERVNIARPLLKEGLVILDTPGLDAIDAEPELTARLIASAQVVIFIVSADTGVTQSDLAIWHAHLGTGGKSGKSSQIRLVVLNKTDASETQRGSPAQAQARIDRLKEDTAAMLELPLAQIVAVSAQQALVAQTTQDTALLQASELPALEQLLGQWVFRPHQDAGRAAVMAEIGQLRCEAARIIDLRQRGLAEQIRELRGLRVKNSGMVSQMRIRNAREQAEFAGGSARVSAVQAVHHALLAQAVDALGVSALKADLAELLDALKPPGVKLNVKKTYRQAFSRLRERLHKGQAVAAEIKSMLDSAFAQANAEFGFSLQTGPVPDLARHGHDLDLVERNYLRHFGLGNVIRLAQADFSDRLVRALSSRLRMLFELALCEVALCSRTAAAQLDTQVLERRHMFARHLEASERIEQAGAALDERIAELQSQESLQKPLAAKLAGLTARLLDHPPERVAAIPPGDQAHTFTALAAPA